MKRALLTLLATLAVLGAGTDLVQAGSWKVQEIKWTVTSQGSPTSGTAIWQRDTSFAALGATAADTTGWFNIKEADPPSAVGVTVTDTMSIGYLVIASDTTVTHGTTTTAMGGVLQMAPKSATATLVTSTTATSVTAPMTSGDKVVVFPIPILNRGHGGAAVDHLSIACLSDFNLRFITTGVNGGGFPMARAYVVYYDAD